jgi:pyridoxamine 5'-phosphate oxidase
MLLAQRLHRVNQSCHGVIMIQVETLDDVLNDCWTRLIRGIRDRRSPFHTPVIATSDSNGPRQRIMVLRGALREPGTLRFHTDRRSAKFATIGDGARAHVLGYDAGARIQLALGGWIVRADSEINSAAWDVTALASRRCYLAKPAPGTRIESNQSGLPEDMLARVPTPEESEAGRDNFTALIVTLDRIEWLHLNARGNSRAIFERNQDQWLGSWLIP